METIIVKNQREFDALPEKFSTYTRIEIRASLRIVIGRAWENASVVAWENASVVARGNASVVARENASVEAWGNASVVARGNASVVARENASVVAWENALVRAFSAGIKLALHGFSILSMPFDMALDFKIEKTCVVQKYKPLPFFDREGIEKKRGKVILFKRVSKDFKTQEGTPRETLWEIGSTVTHPEWDPTSGECGAGKFHACSRPYFCDEFRDRPGDRYIAVEIKVADLFEWKNEPAYPHKIAFYEGTVLYECDKHGRKMKQDK